MAIIGEHWRARSAITTNMVIDKYGIHIECTNEICLRYAEEHYPLISFLLAHASAIDESSNIINNQEINYINYILVSGQSKNSLLNDHSYQGISSPHGSNSGAIVQAKIRIN